MAEIKVKLFGVFRTDAGTPGFEGSFAKVADLFPYLNELETKAYDRKKAADPEAEKPAPVKFRDAIVYVGGEKVGSRLKKFNDGDEVWIMSPASGG